MVCIGDRPSRRLYGYLSRVSLECIIHILPPPDLAGPDPLAQPAREALDAALVMLGHEGEDIEAVSQLGREQLLQLMLVRAMITDGNSLSQAFALMGHPNPLPDSPDPSLYAQIPPSDLVVDPASIPWRDISRAMQDDQSLLDALQSVRSRAVEMVRSELGRPQGLAGTAAPTLHVLLGLEHQILRGALLRDALTYVGYDPGTVEQVAALNEGDAVHRILAPGTRSLDASPQRWLRWMGGRKR